MSTTPGSTTRTCFVIAPIGDAGSDTRKRSDQVLQHIIEPCAEECGYEAVRSDRLGEPGLITSQVITQLVDAPLVIADLSEHNPNVFYELAVRHAVGKPLVQMIRSGERIPFDVAGMRTVQVDHHDLDSVAEAKKELIRQIRAVEKDPSKLHTPISMAINLEGLRSSDQPTERVLADILSSMSDLRSSITSIERRLPRTRAISEVALVNPNTLNLELSFSGPIRNPPNFINPKRYLCDRHHMHPMFDAKGDGVLTAHTCCEAFFEELNEFFDPPGKA
ncbi:MAG TPA: hypothetical protein VGQ36_05255 [Thermoanaerobaculia bacterium]|nr:hypothetical protein [Thermoanaerobaculia bacterium]